MLRLGSLELGAVPRVAVPLSDEHIDVARGASAAGIDIIEIRIDHFRSTEAQHVRSAVADLATLPSIATIRSQSEGGGWSGDDETRIKLFASVLPLVDAVDVELQSTRVLHDVSKLARQAGKVLIGSFHDFDGTPSLSSLKTIVGQGKAAGADIVKIATQCRHDDDVRLLSTLLIELQAQNLVVIGMGPAGLPTRFLFPALGSLITFAAHVPFSTAPGQLPFPQMFETLRRLYPAYDDYQTRRLRLKEGV